MNTKSNITVQVGALAVGGYILSKLIRRSGSKKSVCIIGAGPSGLCTLHAAVKADLGLDVHIFERLPDIGGIWGDGATYGKPHFIPHPHNAPDGSPTPDAHNEKKIPVYSGMYKGLWSNGPKECIEYQDYTYEKHFGHGIGSFPPRPVVLDYMKGRAKPDMMKAQVHMQHDIEFVSFDENTKKFCVFAKDLKANKRSKYQFDWVICCTGHFTIPNIPEFEGLDTFKGKVFHSKELCQVEDLRGKRILVIGASYSAEDIMQQGSKYGAARVVNVHRNKHSHGFDWPKVCHEIVDGCPIKVNGSTVSFSDKDSTSEEFDIIVLATGYIHSFPFIEDSLQLKTKNVLYPPLYEGVVLPSNHRMLYIGMQDQWYTNSMFDVQGAFALGVIAASIDENEKKQGIILPEKAQMEASIKEWISKEKKLDGDFQKIDYQTEYIEKLRAYDFVSSIYPLSNDTGHLLKEWEGYKMEPNQGLARYRNHTFVSNFSKKESVLHLRPWTECFDDSVEKFLADAKEAISKSVITTTTTTAKPTVPSASTSRQTALINLPLDTLWKIIRPCNFEWQKSIVAKTDTIGSSKIIHYLDKTQQTIQVTEVSDKDYRISWSMVASEPSVTYTSRDDTICLTAVTAPKGITFVEWSSEFSSDVSVDVIMDGNLKKRDAFKDLTCKSESIGGNANSESNSECEGTVIHRYYQAIERGDASMMVSCVDDNVEVTFLEGSRNWSSKKTAREKFTAWLNHSNVVVKDLKITKNESDDQSATMQCFLVSCDFGSGPRKMRYEVKKSKGGGDLITLIEHLC